MTPDPESRLFRPESFWLSVCLIVFGVVATIASASISASGLVSVGWSVLLVTGFLMLVAPPGALLAGAVGESSGVAKLSGWLDRLAGLVLLICVSPIIAMIALAIWMIDGEPVLYHRNLRIPGRGSRSVPMFRAHAVNAFTFLELEARIPACLPSDTRLGSFLRRTGLDRLPLLIAVARGDLRIFGTSPFLADSELRRDLERAIRELHPAGSKKLVSFLHRSEFVPGLISATDLSCGDAATRQGGSLYTKLLDCLLMELREHAQRNAPGSVVSVRNPLLIARRFLLTAPRVFAAAVLGNRPVFDELRLGRDLEMRHKPVGEHFRIHRETRTRPFLEPRLVVFYLIALLSAASFFMWFLNQLNGEPTDTPIVSMRVAILGTLASFGLVCEILLGLVIDLRSVQRAKGVDGGREHGGPGGRGDSARS